MTSLRDPSGGLKLAGASVRIALTLGWLLPLLVAGALQSSAAGCSENSGPSCLATGDQCGWFRGTCCNGVHCSNGTCIE